MASAYLDQELTSIELKEYRSHLAVCPLCRRHLQELEETSSFFRNVPAPEVPRELHGYVMRAIESRTSGELSLSQYLNDWMLRLNPRPLSAATGVIISLVLFTITLSGFKPLPTNAEERNWKEAAMLLAPPPPPAPIYSPGSEYNLYNPSQKASSTDSYELPRMVDSGTMSSFSYLAYQKPGNESMSAMVEVDENGRGTLVDVLGDPKDPMVVEQFWWALHDRTFQPATVEGQPVSTRIIFFTEKVDIGG
nr:hypothetical protein [uncultured bacterium]